MAHGLSLELREIQPRTYPSAHQMNGWRRHSKREARLARVSRRPWLRADVKAKRAAKAKDT